MSLPRPVNFLLVCLGLLLVQLLVWAFHGSILWGQGAAWPRVILLVGVLAGVLHVLLLLVQFPDALRWRPRRNARPSAELTAAHRRVSRDLHDRIGSRLVNALASVDTRWPNSAQHRAALEQVLLELRLMVDSMDAPDRTPQELLSQLRSRVQPVFARQGIALEWDMDTAQLPDAKQEALLVLVAQEALSNVLQHAHASQVKVALRPANGGTAWELEVSDNGTAGAQTPSAVGAHEWLSGKGMKNMRERLGEVGGTLVVEPSALGGVCLRAVVARFP